MCKTTFDNKKSRLVTTLDITDMLHHLASKAYDSIYDDVTELVNSIVIGEDTDEVKLRDELVDKVIELLKI